MRDRVIGFVNAIGVVGAGAFGGIVVAALLGLADRPGIDRMAAVAAVVLATIILPPPESEGWRLGAMAGAVFAGVAVVVAEVVVDGSTVGGGQIGALAGAFVAVPFLQRRWSQGWSSRSVVHTGAGIVVALAALAIVAAIVDGGALGHDESAYAVKARAWLDGTPDTGWDLHRAPLLSVLGIPAIAVTDAEEPLRIVGGVLALGTLVASALVADRMGGRWAALVAIAAVAAGPSYLRRGSEYLTDVAAAGILMLATWVILSTVEEDDSRRSRVLWLGFLIPLAFYMRYQASLAIVGLAIATVVAWPGEVRRRLREVSIAAGIAGILLVPHLLWATAVTGIPWGVVTYTQDRAGRAFLGEGLVDYADFFPDLLAGPAGAGFLALALIVSLVSVGRAAVKREMGRWARLSLFVVITVVIAVVPLGLVAHGEPRFVFFPVFLLLAYAAAAVVRLGERVADRWGTRWTAVVVAMAAVIWAPLFIETSARVDRNAEARAETFQVVADASAAIGADGGGECGVLTTYEPQVNWYSACSTALFAPRAEDLGVGRLDAERRYALLFENGKRQPTGGAASAYLELGPSTVVPALNDAIGDATIVRIEDYPATS